VPYVGRALLKTALENLKQNYSPLLTVSLPCMLSHKIPTCISMAQAAKVGIEYGSSQEREWLERYFKPGGGPPDRPWYIPGTGQWVRPRYAETSLQRRRTDFEDSAFFHPNEKRWALRKAAAKAFKDKALEGKPPIPLVALMVWMWRDRNLPSLKEGLTQFIQEVGFDRDGFVGTVYSKEIPEDFSDAGLSDEPPTPEMISDLIGAAPPPPRLPEFADTVNALQESLTKQHMVLIPGLIRRILGGWLVGDIVVLVGPPGTGKTFLATCLGNSLESLLGKERFRTVFIEINRDFDVAEFLGYENLAGEFTTGKFAREVLFVGEATDPRLVVLDEWNLAQIAPILSVIETRKPISLPGKVDVKRLGDIDDVRRAHPEIEEGVCALPEDTFLSPPVTAGLMNRRHGSLSVARSNGDAISSHCRTYSSLRGQARPMPG
jgi:hypothetical protein